VATISADDGPRLPIRGDLPRGSLLRDADGLRDELRGVVAGHLYGRPRGEVREISLIQQDLHDDIAEFVYEKLHRRPLVLPVVVEV
jgi:ribonuclease J